MNKSMKAKAPKIQPLSEEEKKAKIVEFLTRKLEDTAMQVMLNLCKGKGTITKEDGKDIVEASFAMAEEFIGHLYKQTEE